jgi:hypothetical protein
MDEVVVMPINPSLSAFGDLGLGNALQQQTADQVEEERRKRRLGLSQLSQASPSVQQLLGLGGSQFSLGGMR